MANAIITPSMIAKEGLIQLENNLVMANQVHRDYKDEFAKVGSTVSIRRPVQFTATDGATVSLQDVEEESTSITVSSQKHVAWAFTSSDLTLSIEEYSERYIKPACIALANKVDSDLCALYDEVYANVGTAGTAPSTFADVAAAAQRMDEMAIPTDGRKLVLNPAGHWSLADGLKGVFNQQRVEEFIGKGYLGSLANFDIFDDQNIKTHTSGTQTGTPLVNGANQDVTYQSLTSGAGVWEQSLITDGWTNSTTNIVKEGDTFTIADVYQVNPISRESTGVLQEFVVRANADSGASTGPATITISPPIITSGPQQTVDAAPADDAAITVTTANEAANLAFHKNAFALVMCPLELPDGAAFKARESYKGLSIRVIKDYDFANDKDQIRLDILYGVKTIDPRLAVRMNG